MKRICLAGIITAICSLKVLSQDRDLKHSGTVAVFITSFKPSLYWSYTYQPNQIAFSTRVFGFSDERKAWKDNDFPIQKYLDFAILGGLHIARFHKSDILLNSGISYITAIRQGDFIKEEFTLGGSRFRYFQEKKASTVGLPIELKALFLICKGFGITAVGYGNLNSQVSTAGIGLGISFGK